ncbi:hypothetical protein BASA60_008346 [Batrachochytrium salamandrivorans]|nr:hypothetical protein BASA60_008346 [Batrachochytrium salamandrivorans]
MQHISAKSELPSLTDFAQTTAADHLTTQIPIAASISTELATVAGTSNRTVSEALLSMDQAGRIHVLEEQLADTQQKLESINSTMAAQQALLHDTLGRCMSMKDEFTAKEQLLEEKLQLANTTLQAKEDEVKTLDLRLQDTTRQLDRVNAFVANNVIAQADVSAAQTASINNNNNNVGIPTATGSGSGYGSEISSTTDAGPTATAGSATLTLALSGLAASILPSGSGLDIDAATATPMNREASQPSTMSSATLFSKADLHTPMTSIAAMQCIMPCTTSSMLQQHPVLTMMGIDPAPLLLSSLATTPVVTHDHIISATTSPSPASTLASTLALSSMIEPRQQHIDAATAASNIMSMGAGLMQHSLSKTLSAGKSQHQQHMNQQLQFNPHHQLHQQQQQQQHHHHQIYAPPHLSQFSSSVLSQMPLSYPSTSISAAVSTSTVSAASDSLYDRLLSASMPFPMEMDMCVSTAVASRTMSIVTSTPITNSGSNSGNTIAAIAPVSIPDLGAMRLDMQPTSNAALLTSGILPQHELYAPIPVATMAATMAAASLSPDDMIMTSSAALSNSSPDALELIDTPMAAAYFQHDVYHQQQQQQHHLLLHGKMTDQNYMKQQHLIKTNAINSSSSSSSSHGSSDSHSAIHGSNTMPLMSSMEMMSGIIKSTSTGGIGSIYVDASSHTEAAVSAHHLLSSLQCRAPSAPPFTFTDSIFTRIPSQSYSSVSSSTIPTSIPSSIPNSIPNSIPTNATGIPFGTNVGTVTAAFNTADTPCLPRTHHHTRGSSGVSLAVSSSLSSSSPLPQSLPPPSLSRAKSLTYKQPRPLHPHGKHNSYTQLHLQQQHMLQHRQSPPLAPFALPRYNHLRLDIPYNDRESSSSIHSLNASTAVATSPVINTVNGHTSEPLRDISPPSSPPYSGLSLSHTHPQLHQHDPHEPQPSNYHQQTQKLQTQFPLALSPNDIGSGSLKPSQHSDGATVDVNASQMPTPIHSSHPSRSSTLVWIPAGPAIPHRKWKRSELKLLNSFSRTSDSQLSLHSHCQWSHD